MGYRLIKMSTDLFNEMLTEGRRFPNREGEILVVAKGLPEGAKLEAVSAEARFQYDEILLKYSHPSWEDSRPGEQIPEIRVEYRLDRDQPFSGRFHYKTGNTVTRTE